MLGYTRLAVCKNDYVYTYPTFVDSNDGTYNDYFQANGSTYNFIHNDGNQGAISDNTNAKKGMSNGYMVYWEGVWVYWQTPAPTDVGLAISDMGTSEGNPIYYLPTGRFYQYDGRYFMEHLLLHETPNSNFVQTGLRIRGSNGKNYYIGTYMPANATLYRKSNMSTYVESTVGGMQFDMRMKCKWTESYGKRSYSYTYYDLNLQIWNVAVDKNIRVVIQGNSSGVSNLHMEWIVYAHGECRLGTSVNNCNNNSNCVNQDNADNKFWVRNYVTKYIGELNPESKWGMLSGWGQLNYYTVYFYIQADAAASQWKLLGSQQISIDASTSSDTVGPYSTASCRTTWSDVMFKI